MKVRLNPRARRLIVKVHPSTGEVAVVAPSERSVPKALDFAKQEGDWIAGRLAKVPEPVYLEPGDMVRFKGQLYVIRLSPERGGVWIDTDAPRHLIDNVADLARWESKLSMFPAWLSFLRSLALVRAVEGFAILYWYYAQLYRLGDGKGVNRNLGVFKAYREVDATHHRIAKERKSAAA